jgi:hypothetical protein
MTKRFIAAIGFALAMAPGAFAEEPFKVSIDQTVTLKLARAANSVVIGNATVADVSVHDANTLLVTGKAFGSTNLIVLDRGGNKIYENTLDVAGGSPHDLTIVRGTSTYSYSCIDKCRSTPTVGDAQSHFEEVLNSVTAKAATAKGQ